MKTITFKKTLLTAAILSAMTLTGCGGSSSSNDPSAEGTPDNSPDTSQASIYWQTSKSDFDILAGTAVEFITAGAAQVLTNVPFPTPFYGIETDKDSDKSINIATYSRVSESGVIWDRVRAYSYNEDNTLPLSYEDYTYGGYDKTNYGFDENNRLISETEVDVDGNQLYRVAYTLDAQGRVTLEQEFDANDTVTDSTTYEYQQGENGLTIVKTDYDGDTNIAADRIITRKYDNAGNLTQELDDQNGDGSYLVQKDYSYDNDNKQTLIETSDGSVVGGNAILETIRTQTFTYTTDPDTGYETKAEVSLDPNGQGFSQYWIYDANENLLEFGRDNENDGITDTIQQINTYDENNNRLTYARDADADGNYESLDVRTYDNQNRVLTITSYSDAPDDSGTLNGDLSGVDVGAYTEYSYYDTKPSCDVIFADVTLPNMTTRPTGDCLITPLEAKTAFDGQQANVQPVAVARQDEL